MYHVCTMNITLFYMRFAMIRLLFLMISLLILTLQVTPADAADGFPDESGTIPIAAWDVVPWQVIDKPFDAGVVAFHEVSVQVDFSIVASGKVIQTLKVDMPTLNKRTNVWEFVLPIDPAKIPDGPFEVKAICHPGGQGNRDVELVPLTLYANSHGSLGPFTTVHVDAEKGDDANDGSLAKPFQSLIKAVGAAGDGGTVLLAKGEYSPDIIRKGLNRQYWTTITAAPGVKVDDVMISAGRPSTDKLKFQAVTLFADRAEGKYSTILAGENGKTQVWVDQCVMLNKQGRWKGNVDVFGNRYGSYITGGLSTQLNNGPGARLMRDHRIEHITSDAFTSVGVAINCTVIDIDRGPTEAHPDFHQSHVGSSDQFNTNRILYNVRGIDCIAQGFFGLNLKDSAFVNCLYDKIPGNPLRSQYSGKLDHVLFLHITLPNQVWLWRSNLTTRNCYMLNSVISTIGAMQGADLSGMTMDHTHVIGKNTIDNGTQMTGGDPIFVNADQNNFTFPTASPAAGNAPKLQTVPADMDGNQRTGDKVDRGALIAK